MKSSKPDLTVIIPSYNDKQFIADCFDSLQKQDLKKPVEFLIVDDGSTDGTAELLDSLASKAKNSRVFHLKHVGRSAARNFEFSKASAEIVFFAESDAAYSKNFLRECLKHFSNSEVAGVIGKLEAKNLESVWVKCRSAELNARFENSRNPYKPFTAWMYRKKILQEIGGFDENLNIAEDADLAKRVMQKGLKLEFEPKAVWKHQEPDTLLKVWKRFWFRGRQMPKYYKKHGFPKLTLAHDFIMFASIPLAFLYPPTILIFICLAIIQQLMRKDYFAKIESKYWLHLSFWLFFTMIASKLSRLYGIAREVFQ